MSRIRCRAIALAVLAGWLAAVAPVSASAVAPVIKDDGKFFKDDARTKADEQIREIHREFNKDLLIETFPAVPEDLTKDVDMKDKTARNRFFEKWARDRARAADVNGIYILICKLPEHLQVEVGTHTLEKAFTIEDRNELSKKLLSDFREKKYDEGLLDAVDFVAKRLKAHGVRSSAVPVGGGGMMEGLGGLLCVGVLVLAALWLVVGLFRAMTGGGNRGGYAPGGGGYGPGYGGGGGGGGGFMTSLLGGMFGAVAGNWMYNSFFGGGSHMGGGGGFGNSGSVGGTDSSSQPDTDYSGTGGDFGGDDGGGGGGGDFGGGDAGGGGDFGGGGGDFGGGGGDFGGGGGGDF
jgi:hypothetical protein